VKTKESSEYSPNEIVLNSFLKAITICYCCSRIFQHCQHFKDFSAITELWLGLIFLWRDI